MITIEKIARAKQFLEFCARYRVRPAYEDFSKMVSNGQPRNQGALLEAIDIASKMDPVPLLLSTLVCKKGTGLPIMTKGWGAKYKVEQHPYFGRSLSAEETHDQQEKCFETLGPKPRRSPLQRTFSNHQVITRVKQPNPKQDGSEARKRYDKYLEGGTVAEALAAGVTRRDLHWDYDHDFIEIV